ncbi:MAG TPA: prepilin-type N-terminal cleavage/methylation domain-containing protein [Candidatus Omnitrophota bacterium]|nr:prepilin-type N-terminal cleavage/methylation domain-containing protein [Candidatus Omnitrophota bacterium]
MNNRSKKTAFTLIELVISVIILSILMSLATASYVQARKRSQLNSAICMARTLANVAKNRFIYEGNYVGTTNTANTNAVYGTNLLDGYFHNFSVVVGSGTFNITAIAGTNTSNGTHVFNANGTWLSCSGSDCVFP